MLAPVDVTVSSTPSLVTTVVEVKLDVVSVPWADKAPRLAVSPPDDAAGSAVASFDSETGSRDSTIELMGWGSECVASGLLVGARGELVVVCDELAVFAGEFRVVCGGVAGVVVVVGEGGGRVVFAGGAGAGGCCVGEGFPGEGGLFPEPGLPSLSLRLHNGTKRAQEPRDLHHLSKASFLSWRCLAVSWCIAFDRCSCSIQGSVFSRKRTRCNAKGLNECGC